jgi:hypothetical protein
MAGESMIRNMVDYWNGVFHANNSGVRYILDDGGVSIQYSDKLVDFSIPRNGNPSFVGESYVFIRETAREIFKKIQAEMNDSSCN